MRNCQKYIYSVFFSFACVDYEAQKKSSPFCEETVGV